jgi:glycosyltransferase involved in cell wall biosynthesis
MKVWLMTIGEPLPTCERKNRLLRTGLLANALKDKGHQVTWWTSTFDHTTKCHRFDRDSVFHAEENLEIVLLHGVGYEKNVSLRRLLDHIIIAFKFLQRSRSAPKPDIILCSLPTLELGVAAVRYGKRMGVPVILDVRDLWPDIFLELVPQRWRSIAKAALQPMFWAVRRACKGATGIIGNSPGFVNWGVRYAQRPPGRWDRDFPFGYSQQAPNTALIEQAKLFWATFGLDGKREDCCVVCFFGTISRQFELDTVIEAARRLEKGGRKFKFVLCGAGDAVEGYKKLAGDCESVIFPGWVGAPEIWTLMQMSDAGLAPYKNGEGFKDNLPNKPIEYLSAGLPVISSLNGYLQALLKEHACGLTYRGSDAGSLVDTLANLYDDRAALHIMSQNAFALYKKKFVAEKIYEELISYLEQVKAARYPPGSEK